MGFRHRLTALLIALVFTLSVAAHSAQLAPAAPPVVFEIQAIGLSLVDSGSDGPFGCEG